MIQSGNRVRSRCRTIDIFSCRRRHTIGHRLICQTSIRSRSRLCTERYIGGYRIKPRLEGTASRIFVILKRFCIGVGNISCKCIYFRNIRILSPFAFTSGASDAATTVFKIAATSFSPIVFPASLSSFAILAVMAATSSAPSPLP